MLRFCNTLIAAKDRPGNNDEVISWTFLIERDLE
jgi:hypothetical protein